MVHGIETGSKKYTHFRRDDEKWLLTDLQEIKKTVSHYIAGLPPPTDQGPSVGKTSHRRKMLMYDIVLGILVFGILGSLSVITGAYLTIQGKAGVGAPLSIFGLVFILVFILFLKYR